MFINDCLNSIIKLYMNFSLSASDVIHKMTGCNFLWVQWRTVSAIKSCWLNCTSPVIMSVDASPFDASTASSWLARYGYGRNATLKRACAFLRLWIANVSGAEKSVTRASELLLHPKLFTSPNLSRDARVARSFHRYPARLRSFRMQLSILRYEQTTLHNLRDCVHTATANFSMRGDALRIMQRPYRARPLICVWSCVMLGI